jgi:hypothetical protein
MDAMGHLISRHWKPLPTLLLARRVRGEPVQQGPEILSLVEVARWPGGMARRATDVSAQFSPRQPEAA